MPVQRPYGGVAADERREQRRHALLEAALTCLGRDGGDVSVRSVCAEARLTARYFYESFANLDDLLVTLITQIAEEVARGAEAALRERRPSGLHDSCRTAFEGAYSVLRRDHRKARATLVIASGAEGLQEARRKIVLSYVEGMLSTIGDALGESVGTVRTRAAVVFAVGGTLELMNAVLSGDVPLEDDELADQVAGLLSASVSQVRPG